MAEAVSPSKPLVAEVERDPIHLVRQYVSSPSTNVRRNTATALGALVESNPGAARALVDMVLAEKDEQVRFHIFTELSRLSAGGRQAILEYTQELFDSNQSTSRSAAYLFLVRLRALGWAIPVSKGVTREVLMALTAEETVQGRRFRVMLLGAVAVSSLVAALLAAIYVLSRINTAGGGGGYVVVGIGIAALAATLISLLASRAAVPGFLHLRRSIGNTLDTLIAAVLAGLSWFVTVVIVQAVSETTDSLARSLAVAAFAAATIGVAVGGVRAGTLIAHELPPISRLISDPDWRRHRLRGWATRVFLSEVLLGSIIGFLAVVGMDRLGRQWLPHAPATEAARLIEGSTWLAVVVLLPTAVAFAIIDRPQFLLRWLSQYTAPPTESGSEAGSFTERLLARHRPDWWSKLARALIQGFAVILLFMVSQGLLRDAPNLGGLPRLVSTEPSENRVWMMSFPVQHEFAVGFLQPVTFTTGQDPDLPLRAQLFQWPPASFDDEGSPICVSGDERDRTSVFTAQRLPHTETLGRGCYSLQITRAATTELGRAKAIAVLLDAWSLARAEPATVADDHTTPLAERPPAPYELRLSANAEKYRPADPFNNDLEESEVGVGLWQIDEVPWEREVYLRTPLALEWRLTPSEVRISGDAAPESSRTGEGSRPSRDQARPLTFTINRDKDKEVIADYSRLQPGRYTIRVTSDGDAKGKTGFVSLDIATAGIDVSADESRPNLPTLSQNLFVRSDPIHGIWEFNGVPTALHFTVRTPRRLRAAVPYVTFNSPFREEGLDLELVLESRGREIASGDDPERIDEDLGPGEYSLLIHRLGARTVTIPLVPLWMVLEFSAPVNEPR
jgi:hypothetical protein